MPRLFTAIEIPASVAQMLTFLRGGLPGARWIDPQNYHITLRFIGDVDLTCRERRGLDARYASTARRSSCGWTGLRPSAAASRARCSPMSRRRRRLMDLQAEHERLMQRVGLEPEGRKYTPHVTLARLRDSSSRQVADYLSERGSFRSAPFRVERFVLYSSRDSVGGGPYVVEEAYPLGGDPREAGDVTARYEVQRLPESRHLRADGLRLAGHADKVEPAEAVLRSLVARAIIIASRELVGLIIAFGDQRRRRALAGAVRHDLDAGAQAATVIGADHDGLRRQQPQAMRIDRAVVVADREEQAAVEIIEPQQMRVMVFDAAGWAAP